LIFLLVISNKQHYLSVAHNGSQKPLLLLTDSKCLLIAIQKWIGEGIDPTIKDSPDGDILREILELLRNRIEMGLFTLFVKIKSHRGEFFNEMADRWVDKGRDTEVEDRWTSLRQRPIFTWTASGKKHCSTMNKVVKTRAHLIAARLEIPKHDNLTARFLKKEGNCRADLGIHWKDKKVSFKAKRRLLQSISFQFPCAANFKKWGWQEEDECRLCKALYPERTAFSECLGHIQGHCKALQKPRIAVHHGIWRDLIMRIGKQSLEENEDGSRKWAFPTSTSTTQHEEWEMREILEHMGLMINTNQGRSEMRRAITEFHCTRGYWDAEELNDTEAFLKVRPDGVAFDELARMCAFLEFTRPMDSRDGASEQPDWYTGADWSLDWAQDKGLEKNTRYARHLEFIKWISIKRGNTWTTAQYNFTVGVRGSAIEAAWEDRLINLGVSVSKTRVVIRRQAIRKTLELSDVMLRQFHVATQTSPEWALHALTDDISNTTTERFNLHKKFLGPMSGMQ